MNNPIVMTNIESVINEWFLLTAVSVTAMIIAYKIWKEVRKK
jgi:hypothetical protein